MFPEELRRLQLYLDWEVRRWTERTTAMAGDQQTGLRALAAEQAAMYQQAADALRTQSGQFIREATQWILASGASPEGIGFLANAD
ncbi:hypothetical protein C8R47DRAFT_1213198 [Mycena vitilis]|nr:hypothetical protein C8R47DRAFT_1213198 [Mycena vitilis]